MSQAGIVDFIGTHPEIPTMFVANVGTAVPIANTIELLGAAVAAHGVPLQTVASGNTVDFNIQYSSAAASSIAGNAGAASFDSASFAVDANGFVTLSGGAFVESFNVDANTPPGTDPVLPNGSGQVTVTGGQAAAGTTTNVIRTISLAANTYTIQIQRSQAVAVSTVGDNGVSHFNSTYFTVDSDGFVSVSGTGLGQTITGDTGGALSPTAGNWNIFGASVAPGTSPVATSGSGSTLTVNVQKSQAIASTNATNVGLAAFNSTYFTVDSNGFVSVSGTGLGQTITGNVGGALSPTAGNWNILGTSTAAGTTPVQTSGSGSTLTVQVQKAQAIGATDATNIGLAAFSSAQFSVDANGFVTLSGTGAGQTITGNSGGALSPTGGNWNIVGTGSITTSGAVSTLTVQLTGLTNHAVQVGAGTATLTQVAPSSTAGIPLVSNGSSADPSFTTAVVAGGGTGNTTFTAYSVICAGTTATGAFQNVSGVGTSGQVLTSNGAAALPTWQAAAGGITTINGDTGSVTGSTVTIFSNIAGEGAGASVSFSGSGTTMTFQNTDANGNTWIGNGSGKTASAATFNTGIGYNSYNAITTGGDYNSIVGVNCFRAATSATKNNGLGYQVLDALTTGSFNIGIGHDAGLAYTSSESSNICIGGEVQGTAGESNALRIGNGTGTGNGSLNKAFIAGIAGITVTSTAAVLVNTSTDQLGTIVSSKRFKENIEDMGDASSFIHKLRPVKFTYKDHPDYGEHTGLIAEEVLEVAPQLVCYDNKNMPCAVQYHELPALLLNEIQKLRKEIDELKARLG